MEKRENAISFPVLTKEETDLLKIILTSKSELAIKYKEKLKAILSL